MELKLSDFPEISQAPADRKLELIDELWEDVRRSTLQNSVPTSHLQELESRLQVVEEKPSIALTPSEARAQLKR
jgi:hypothetical protein